MNKKKLNAAFDALEEKTFGIFSTLLSDGFYDELNEYFKTNILRKAIVNRNIEAIELLLKKGANLYSEEGVDSRFPIVFAFLYPESEFDIESEKVFLDRFLKLLPDLSITDVSGNTLMHLACIDNRIECLDLIVSNGISVDQYNNIKQTPIFTAGFFGSKDCLEFLIYRNAKIDFLNQEGKTPLSVAVENDEPDIECIEILLKNGANVNHVDFDGRTPIFYAAQAGDPDVIELLIKFGADVNHSDFNGDTAVFFAILEDNIEALKVLIENNANQNHVNFDGLTPIYTAVELDCYSCAGLLLSNGVNLEHDYREVVGGDKEINIADLAVGMSDSIADLIKSHQENISLQNIINNTNSVEEGGLRF